MPSTQSDSLVHAFRVLGLRTEPNKSGRLELELPKGKIEVDAVRLLKSLPESSLVDETAMAIAVASALHLAIPDELTLDLSRIRPYLRPRLIPQDHLVGPIRTMCRRDAFGAMVSAVSVGGLGSRAFVMTHHLDAWGAQFEDILVTAQQNLAPTLPKLSTPLPRDSYTALTSESDPIAPMILASPNACPAFDAPNGVLAMLPHEHQLVLLPVSRGAGSDALIAMIKTVYRNLRDAPSALTNQLFWRRTRDNGKPQVTHLPITEIVEGDSRRIQLDAEGPVATVLALLDGE